MTSSDCIFCKIRDKELPAEILYEDEDVVMFPDKFPKAPTHLLLIPRVHVESVLTLDEQTKGIPGMLILKAKQFAKEKGIPGYKLTFHVGREGGQVIDHLHLHLMAERKI
ncbi:MAG: HIT domain-containing protein [Patescibacteria group bacterium]